MGSLEAIAMAIRECAECSLRERRIQAVPGEGPQDTDIVFIGEAPGAREDELGRPFVGRSGSLLDQQLEVIGLGRGDVFITNLVKCRPPDNRAPRKAEITACRQFLKRQLTVVQPKLIVTLGRFATSQFVSGRISDLHGQPRTVDGWTIYPVFHPAAALRRTSWKQALEEDLQRLPDLIEVMPMDVKVPDAIRVDRCFVGGHPGYVETAYPPDEWVIVGSVGYEWGDPPTGWLEEMREKGASVAAYACDGLWFAIKERGLDEEEQ